MEYKLKVSKRARYMRLEVKRSGELVVTVPPGLDFGFIEGFIDKKSNWIKEKFTQLNNLAESEIKISKILFNRVKYVESIKSKIFLNGSKREYVKYKEVARLLAENRISHYNKLYNFKIHPVKFREAEISQKVKLFNRVNKISIKNAKSRWGSCSKKGNLNFNYKIALLPQNLADYVIVHELCHLAEFNHSKKFWNLVSLAVPDYKELRLSFK